MKAVLLYHPAPNVGENAPPHFPAHSARLDEFHARGDLLMVGVFGDPQAEGSMSIFASREAAQEFVDGDPFLEHGVIESFELRDWDEAYQT